VFFPSAGDGRRTGAGRRQNGTKMAATDRFGLRFLIPNARTRRYKAKTQAKRRAGQLRRFGAQGRVNSCGISSRVETTIAPRLHGAIHTTGGRERYYYCSINTERRNSENTCSNCGNRVPLISKDFRDLMVNKDLDSIQIGPILAKSVVPALVRLYGCPDI
jgi:hypothetical protein